MPRLCLAPLLLLVVLLTLAACAGDPAPAPMDPTVDPPTDTTLDSTAAPSEGSAPTASAPTAPTSAASDPSSQTSTTAAPVLDPLQGLAYEPVAEVAFPTVLLVMDGSLLVGQRSGVVSSLDDGEMGEIVVDISSQTTTDGERGLLGMAVHPEDDSRLFLHYTDTSGNTTVSELLIEEGTAGSERVLLTVEQPAANHNGGMIQFGPDGALYLGLGDGGGSGDQFGNAQNTDTLLGGIVRIDVESGESTLWQIGLRNPWRFWIDGEDLWIGDVGQAVYEEVNLAPIGQQGVNYGWPIMEGLHCYQADDCATEGLTLPILEVDHGDEGTCSITGGVVYRGAAIPELEGRFLFSDFCGGWLRSADRSGEVMDHPDVGVAGSVVSFGVDADGEVYVLTTAEILRLVPVR